MTAGISIVVPVKGLRAGKSRLAQTMTDDARWELNRHLTERTLGIATAFADTADVYAVSPDPDVEEIAASFSVRFLHQSGDGLNPGLEEAACQLPGGRTIYLAVDLPDLATDDIRALAETTGIGIATDLRGLGTNALSVPAPRTLAFRFGPNSFELHRMLAIESGFAVETVMRPGLAFDLDTENDFLRANRYTKGCPKSTNPRNLRT